ncbi:hypothetical protein TELCIR_09839 [Teladorsagia circumcincta]|uniref:Uncharacterized protein n=1 Tax=Teladorsagia circumcincta TaxID=45464 RepID=A0A2G9UDS0_TELCI|nr:hypothetical protein TELCIR_09839 [Teladorsagia circumcincta]
MPSFNSYGVPIENVYNRMRSPKHKRFVMPSNSSHRQVPTFSPTFPDLDTGDSDDDYAVTTDERKEEREEKHGQKVRFWSTSAIF